MLIHDLLALPARLSSQMFLVELRVTEFWLEQLFGCSQFLSISVLLSDYFFITWHSSVSVFHISSSRLLPEQQMLSRSLKAFLGSSTFGELFWMKAKLKQKKNECRLINKRAKFCNCLLGSAWRLVASFCCRIRDTRFVFLDQELWSKHREIANYKELIFFVFRFELNKWCSINRLKR